VLIPYTRNHKRITIYRPYDFTHPNKGGTNDLAVSYQRSSEDIGGLMESKPGSYASIDEYIAMFPNDIQKILEELRATIRAAAPEAKEKISYQMPTFDLKGNLVHFAAHTHHIGFYPTPSGIDAFKNELSIYASAKGSVQFPIDKPLPLKLISKIVKFRVVENQKKAEIKSRKKK
jgi:uncharacterized protein YdhG (YjbR/CyaY superfamily)